MLHCIDVNNTDSKADEFSICHETHIVILFCMPIARAIQLKFGNIYVHVDDTNCVASAVECAVINVATRRCFSAYLFWKLHNKLYTIPTNSIRCPLQSSLPLIYIDCYYVHIVGRKFLLHSNHLEVLLFRHQTLLMFSVKNQISRIVTHDQIILHHD